SIIEFEAILYQKFLILSASHSLISEKMFRKLLNDMHAKGYISPTEFNKMRCWKRQVVLEDLESREITPDEFEQVFRERAIIATSGGSHPITKGIVSDSSTVADAIRKAMIAKLYEGKPLDIRKSQDIQMHAKHMRKALTSSSEEFLEYIKQNVPSLLEDMEQILREKGENVVLLGLRIVSTS
ncbi:MAG: hypothetical protein ACFFDR_08110, partial [Candidatus Thorarchaeota archaeon]